MNIEYGNEDHMSNHEDIDIYGQQPEDEEGGPSEHMSEFNEPLDCDDPIGHTETFHNNGTGTCIQNHQNPEFNSHEDAAGFENGGEEDEFAMDLTHVS